MEFHPNIQKQLRSLLVVPQGEVDDTRFERLYDILKKYCTHGGIKPFELNNQGFLDTMQVL